MDLMDYRRKIIANSPHLKSASGSIVSFSDWADLPLKSLLVNIDPVHSGTGDPSPSNVRPISGWNGVRVTRCGKNLLDTSVMHSGLLALTVGASEDSVTQSSRYGYSDRIPSTSAMVISARSDDTTNYNWIRVIQYVNGIVVAVIGGFENIESTKTLAIPARENSYIRVLYGANPAGAVSTSVIGYTQVELGSTATPYEPYNGVTVTVQLGETVYGGRLNPLTGVLTVDRLGVPMESLTWYRSTSYANPLFYATVTGKASDYRKACCSMFRNIGSATIIAAQGFANQSADGNFASSNGNAQIFVRLDSATTVQAFVTAVTGQTIVYPLANPTTIQLTPHQIRSLYGNNTIFADTGNVALEYWAHP